jgi:hypothetical protein
MTVRKSEKTGWCKRSSSTRSGRARSEESMARALVPVLVPGTYVLIASNALLSHTAAMALQSAGVDGHELVVQRLPPSVSRSRCPG